jgi:hypothetical protein
MEPIEGSETSAFKPQTPGKYPKENIIHKEHGESSKSRHIIPLYKKSSKGNVRPRTSHEGPEGRAEVKLYSFFNFGARWGEWSTPRPGRFDPGERYGIRRMGGWVGSRAGLDGWGKSRPPPGFDPQAVQPVASRYTDCAIAVHIQGPPKKMYTYFNERKLYVV